MQIKQIEKEVADDVIKSVEVICATCIGSGVDLLDNREFPVVVMDGNLDLNLLFDHQSAHKLRNLQV